MSYSVFFDFSSGLNKSILVASDTLKKVLAQVQHIESALGYETTQYRDNPKRWKNTKAKDGVSDKVLCETAEQHNGFVRWLYHAFNEWNENPPKKAETITPKDAEKFWHGLQIINVPPERWTGDYYRARMESLYEVMRGLEGEGVTFDEKALTPRQAAQVINLFSEYLDKEDLRLDVPLGHDYLASSSDGGYEWCEKCGAITYEDAVDCRKRKCPLRAELRVDQL